MDNIKKLWIGIGILAILTPLGLLAEGTVWGEWGATELEGVQYIPRGMAKLSNMWHSILPDYNIPGWGRSFVLSSFGYILSAIVGIIIVTVIMFGVGKFVASEGRTKN